MLIGKKIVPFIIEFIDGLDDAISQHDSQKKLSAIQKYWLAFCLMGILATQSVCWAKFERVSCGQYSSAALSWVFYHASIPWELLLQFSTKLILNHYGITQGSLVIDDSDNKRSKNTKKIWYVHKLKDKASGGYVMGQGLVFMVLVTPTITLPVGIEFYMPDPAYSLWKKNDNKLKKEGIAAKKRPPKPEKNEQFPTKIEIAIRLIKQFEGCFPGINIKCVIADALYGTDKFFSGVKKNYPKIQIISQIKKTHNILFRNRKMSVQKYFSSYGGVSRTLCIRGDKEIKSTIGSARLQVCSHGKKCFIIALKYEDEEEYRFIIASDMSWRTMDIVEAYSLRWLVEVFIQDWKANEGWATLTKLQGEKGSRRGMILSLLVDHCLFFHPEQKIQFKNKLPALTVGCLRHKTNLESLILFITEIVDAKEPHKELEQKFLIMKENLLDFDKSKKHMVGRELGRMEPTESLKYKNVA